MIELYQKYSFSIFGNSKKCRYYPTCSQYMKEAILKYGTLYGVFLGIMRILRCNQFFKGGFDPVP